MEIIGYYTPFLVACFGIYFVNCSRDLALNKTATQSSTYQEYVKGHLTRYDAGKAVDGILATQLESGHCSHTGSGHNQAWWKVDLGQVYRIQMINITYRHHDPSRLQGYSLYVTNDNDMTQSDGSIHAHNGDLCYHDTSTAADLPTYNQTRQCRHVNGQYVVFYNSKSSGEGAYIELCEVQVYGCPVGQFGYNCSGSCHCTTGGCDPDTGQCDAKGCQTGWMGLSCGLRCHCDRGVACDIDTGACPGGRCQSGWSGQSCFVNSRDISYGKPALQSTTYNGYVANKAVDGVITKEVGRHGSCSHTDPERGHPEAWWQVDIGSVQWIRTINIVYRQLYPFTMSGFYLYVSNRSISNTYIPIVLDNSHLCYHDHGPGLPSYIQSLSCSVSGRYVIFYNKRPADYEPKNVMYYNTTTASIMLCEVQVLGGCPPGRKGISCDQACDAGTFGLDCAQTCHCATSDCNKQTGVCTTTGCSAGWRGTSCDQGCTGHTFGQDCTQTCHCANPGFDIRTGVCKVPGCTEGWKGQTCSQACTNHTFGRDCAQICHCATSDCDKGSGLCFKVGCEAGWMGRTCSQACTNHTFGRDCTQTCHCAYSDCDMRTGVCKVPGCMEGLRGQTCSQACTNHTFGRDCNQTCQCANSDCDRRTGVCKAPGCTEGWRGQTCSKACIYNTFGPDCSQTCHCANSDCDRRTGLCKVPGCTEGWNGQTCSQGCVTNTFGQDCAQTCHCANSDCDRTTGICKAPGCDMGWNGISCSQECRTGYFGPNCTEECHCQSPGCNHRNGTCHNVGCEVGWSGKACDQPCTNHTFGRDCNQTCHCAHSDCDGRTGVCYKSGCDDGWIGKTCSQAQTRTGTTTKTRHSKEDQSFPKCTTGYAVFGSILAISITCNIGLIIHCLRMRGKTIRTSTPSTELHTYHMPDHDGNYEGLDSTKIDTTRNVYDTIGRQGD